MRSHYRRYIDPYREERKAELWAWFHRNVLRIALAVIIVIGLLLFIPSFARCHRFNGGDMAVLGGVLFRFLGKRL